MVEACGDKSREAELTEKCKKFDKFEIEHTKLEAAYNIAHEGKLIADTDDGVQGGHGVLEDHGDFVAPDLVEVLLGNFQQVLTVIDDLAGLHDGGTRAGRRLPRLPTPSCGPAFSWGC